MHWHPLPASIVGDLGCLTQAPLALTAAACCAVAGSAAHIPSQRITFCIVAAVMAGIVAVTLLVIKPTNDKLLGNRAWSPAETAGLLRRWDSCHAVRTVASTVAFGALVLQSLSVK